MLELLANLLLLLSSAASAVWLLHRHRQEVPERHPLVRVFAVSTLFIGADALTRLLIQAQSNDQHTLLQMTENLALYVALPFLATLLLAAAKGWYWSMAAWGRWLLGLIAFFELARRADMGAAYTQGLFIAILLCMALGGLLLAGKAASRYGLSASLLLLPALLWFAPLAVLTGHSHAGAFALTLAAALPCMALALHSHLRQLPLPSSAAQ